MLNHSFYKSLVRPLLFSLPPETAQRVVDVALKQHLIWKHLSSVFQVRNSKLNVNLAGLEIANPVGLAAGYDKNCQLLPSLASLGFGYLTCGTVTELPRKGNPKPRIIRYIKNQSLVNSLGFPNLGAEFAAHQLEKARTRLGKTPIIVSISGTTIDEILRCHKRLESLSNAIEINISSPNTANLREFHNIPVLEKLLDSLNDQRTKPLFVKLPPYPHKSSKGISLLPAREEVLEMARTCVAKDVECLTIANTKPIHEIQLVVGTGGLSGKSIFEDTLRMVSEIRREVGRNTYINASGGIFSGDDAWKALNAGANTVQLYTGLIYRGPSVSKKINLELLSAMDLKETAHQNTI